MKRIIIGALISTALMGVQADAVTERPLPSLTPVALEQKSTETFSFAVFGDFRTLRRDRPYGPAFRQIVEEVATVAPPFVLSTGDAYYGYGASFQRFKNEVDYFLSFIKQIPSPVFNAVGNHEVTGEPERQRYAAERFGLLYGSFDYGNAHFIALNTEEPGHEGSVSGDQLAWLEADLAANAKAAHRFVFLHRPLFSVVDPDLSHGKSFKTKEKRDALHALFVKYSVDIVFAGHEHLFSDTTHGGVRYMVVGGGGAPMYDSPQAGGFFHYLIAEVAGSSVKVQVREPFHVQIRHLTASNGFEPRAELEVINTGYSPLSVRNIRVV
ncbi:MAG TPA: metallophosphoesterase, partial [Dissulfurispiraceae bacterium]|nr:metallophosphoesterase [Dissulfurispiraceae bacterium]